MRVARVLAPNPGPFTLEGTNTWVVGNDPCLVIDPGPDDQAHLRAVLAEAGSVEAILLTHHHSDHAAGAASLSRLASAPVHAALPRQPELELRDGDRFGRGDAVLQAMSAPGHSRDHVVYFAPQSGALFTGDALLGRGTSVIDPPDGDLADYLDSLERMLDLAPTVIHPGHGPVVADAPGRIRQYLEHRRERERQLLEGLAAGARTPSELVGRIYVEERPEVLAAAARSVLAHLLKLESEGRVARVGEEFELREA